MVKKGRKKLMRPAREILRLHFEHHLSRRAIARACSVSPTTVGDYLDRIVSTGKDWRTVSALDDSSLKTLLSPDGGKTARKPMPDFDYLRMEDEDKGRYPPTSLGGVPLDPSRRLSKEIILSLLHNGWVKGKQNVIITGPTGSGKTYIACALANSACRSGHSAYYVRLPRLLQELHIARADGSYGKLLTRLAKYAILVIDDWGLAKLGDKERCDILEVLEDRHGISSTIVASQIPTEKWHDTIGDPTIADAVLDRLVHNAHMITMSMKGDSMRKLMSKSK